MFKRKLEDGSCNSDSVQHLVADVSTVKFQEDLPRNSYLTKVFHPNK
mgnify:CR=1 FL=1